MGTHSAFAAPREGSSVRYKATGPAGEGGRPRQPLGSQVSERRVGLGRVARRPSVTAATDPEHSPPNGSHTTSSGPVTALSG
jgi:hypothetical protein